MKLIIILFSLEGVEKGLTQEPKKLALQNTQYFEEKRRRHCTVFKKNLVFIFVE
jgi:hypothetical protein